MVINRRCFIQQSVIAGLGLCIPLRLPATDVKSVNNDFFVFENGLHIQGRALSASQAILLQKLGYDGMEKNGLANLEETYRNLSEKGLRLFTAYVAVDLEKEQQPYSKEFEKALSFMGEKGIMPWLYFPSPNKIYLPSSSYHDKTAVPVLRQLADVAAQHQVKLMLYPHMWYWIESVEDAVRVAQKVERPNMGITFNLCHYLAHCHTHQQDPWEKLPSLVDKAYPHMFAMSINGADLKPAYPENIWKSFIQPLGSGDFDTYAFLKLFLDKGFSGPVGLQCYNISMPAEEHLKQSMKTWQLYKNRYNTRR